MSLDIETGPLGARNLRAGLESLHRNWVWYLALGIALVILGAIILASPVIPTLAAVLVFGWMMVLGGVIQLVGAFWARFWSGVFASLVSGLLYLIVGVMTFRHPGTADLALTLLIASYLIVGGLFRIIASMQVRHHGWGWGVLSGAISALLGFSIFATAPVSALWVLGTLIGVDMLFQGWAWILLALAVRRLPSRADSPPV